MHQQKHVIPLAVNSLQTARFQVVSIVSGSINLYKVWGSQELSSATWSGLVSSIPAVGKQLVFSLCRQCHPLVQYGQTWTDGKLGDASHILLNTQLMCAWLPLFSARPTAIDYQIMLLCDRCTDEYVNEQLVHWPASLDENEIVGLQTASPTPTTSVSHYTARVQDTETLSQKVDGWSTP